MTRYLTDRWVHTCSRCGVKLQPSPSADELARKQRVVDATLDALAAGDWRGLHGQARYLTDSAALDRIAALFADGTPDGLRASAEALEEIARLVRLTARTAGQQYDDGQEP